MTVEKRLTLNTLSFSKKLIYSCKFKISQWVFVPPSFRRWCCVCRNYMSGSGYHCLIFFMLWFLQLLFYKIISLLILNKNFFEFLVIHIDNPKLCILRLVILNQIRTDGGMVARLFVEKSFLRDKWSRIISEMLRHGDIPINILQKIDKIIS